MAGRLFSGGHPPAGVIAGMTGFGNDKIVELISKISIYSQ
jgi:hypothetical protein